MCGNPYSQEYMEKELIGYEEVPFLKPGENLILSKYNSMDFSTSRIEIELSCDAGIFKFNKPL